MVDWADWVVVGIAVEVVPNAEPDWVFLGEPLKLGVLIFGAKEVEARGVEFAAGIGEAVRCCRPARCRVAERLKRVLRLEGSAQVRQRQRRTLGVSQETPRTGRVRSLKDFVYPAAQ